MNRLLFAISILLITTGTFAQTAKYKIVYNVLEDREKDNYDIYSMNMDGTGKKNITNTPGVEWVYYAYGNKVYYISDVDTCHRCYFLYEMDADGNNKQKITALQLEDSWMGSRNNGTEMIVTGRIGKLRQQLFVVDLKTGSYQQLTNDTVSYKTDPVFSPDGKQILLRYRPDRKQRQTVFDELWLLNEKAEPIRQLTSFPKADTTTAWFEYHAGPPQWNSKHGFISYMSRQNKQTQIYAVNIDGKKQWQLTSGELSSGWHAWSDDGEWLAMDRSTHEGKNFDIYLLHYASGKIIQLTSDIKTEQAPVIVRAD
ncbi:MAG: TolB family protein [Lacibacter sp.]